MSTRPWEQGDHETRWVGYLDPDTIAPHAPRVGVLRNKFGIKDPDLLADAENDHVEARRETLDETKVHDSYGFDRLSSIHSHLFQDVYEWAGELRTVEIGKGSGYFAPVDELVDRLSALETMVEDRHRLHDAEGVDLVRNLAELYNHVNTTHPFREGNGRTQRAYLDQLASVTGHYLEWSRVLGSANDEISNQAQHTGNLDRMTRMFARITRRESETPHPGSLGE